MADRRGSLIAATFIALAAGLTLGGYELVRSPIQTLYKAEFGKDNLPMVMAGLPLAVGVVLYVYARILSWLGARKTLLVTTVGSAIIIAICQLLYTRLGVRGAIAVLYLFGSAYVALLIEQYWSFLNSTLTEKDARAVNGPICGVASLGSIAAGVIGSGLTARLGTAGMLLLAAGVTLPAALLSELAYRKGGEPKDQAASAPKEKGHLALAEFKAHPVLPLVFALVVATQVVAAFLSLALQGVMQDTIPNVDQQTAYSFAFYAKLNTVAAILQFAVAPLIMRFTSPGLVHVLIPCVHIVALAAFLREPTLATVAFAYLVFKALDYSVFRVAKEVLYMPLPFDARYRAKEVIDVFGYRFSKGVTAGVVTLLQNAGLRFVETSYGLAALVASAVWALIALPLRRHYERPDADERSRT